ncbi:uncharacterized protein KLLA0_D04686g [Kluyveromyces lactis]|uniref:KLLA0D04686p n=1 Tax=Kluyveromyces lactis (strain ATCC 8585 / CBS 2359 / DSM 70799 / NBRC 1267 / NRRL Y-1140 / WM37) TaxID=284590 RepID=Q6CS20_KLULA|nr:uncharacterized protein KLLA0_D04686g [Kluyveromyces lactis]CAH00365.1 KLLA0D04686p [Kluyveromyces lactis]|eukprot:XP_453269.1 uncharacterized protein KLLA0_D04686g [Kluyveromyces lactis]
MVPVGRLNGISSRIDGSVRKMKNPPQKNEGSLDDPVGISDSPGYLYMYRGAFAPTTLSNPHTVYVTCQGAYCIGGHLIPCERLCKALLFIIKPRAKKPNNVCSGPICETLLVPVQVPRPA